MSGVFLAYLTKLCSYAGPALNSGPALNYAGPALNFLDQENLEETEIRSRYKTSAADFKPSILDWE